MTQDTVTSLLVDMMGITMKLAMPLLLSALVVGLLIGLSLALASDLVVAKESAYFLLAFVNIGLVSALTRHLGSISLHGDLGQIVVGNGTGTALKSLSVQSMFEVGTTTGATAHTSQFFGSLGTLKVAGNINGAYVLVSSGGSLGSATIGGSLLGTGFDAGGAIYAEGTLGTVAVKGHVLGGSGDYSGSIGAGGCDRRNTR